VETDLDLDVDVDHDSTCVHADAFCHSLMPLLSVEGHFANINSCFLNENFMLCALIMLYPTVKHFTFVLIGFSEVMN